MQNLIDPIKLSNSGYETSGKISLECFSKLITLCYDSPVQPILEYSLKFKREGDKPSINGTVKTALRLQCQRCLQSYEQEFDIKFKLYPVNSEKSAIALQEENDSYEPVVLNNGKLSITDILEDEIILGMPIVPMHSENNPECDHRLNLEEGICNDSEVVQNPFGTLESLKHLISKNEV